MGDFATAECGRVWTGRGRDEMRWRIEDEVSLDFHLCSRTMSRASKRAPSKFTYNPNP